MTEASILLSVFTRVPVAGQVKTRLIPSLGVEGATNLYLAMLKKTLESARASNANKVSLCCTPTDEHASIINLASEHAMETQLQTGRDLGEKMCNAINSGLESHEAVIILGCDCPSVKIEDINCAVKKLESGYDAVLGPALDGGYYLIGLRKPHDDLFQNISWGTNTVLQATRSRLLEAGYSWHELPCYSDIDDKDDLVELEKHRDLLHLAQRDEPDSTEIQTTA